MLDTVTMYWIYSYCLVVSMAGLGIVLSVDVNSVCYIPLASPMLSSMATYKIIYMDRVDLVKIKSGMAAGFEQRWKTFCIIKILTSTHSRKGFTNLLIV